MHRILCLFLFTSLLFSCSEISQTQNPSPANVWADSVYQSLTPAQRVAQLFVLRLSEKKGDSIIFHTEEVKRFIQQYNIGAVCLFQGGPEQQASLINEFQAMAKTPILFCIDAETGVGMRMPDSIMKFPDQLTLGAIDDTSLIYKIGNAIGAQCKRMGIQVNYAPVVDINNNPANPVINVRSFGEDKKKVALYGVYMMKGMQDEGILACAKHFPGHGDVSVDSHKDLPVIEKSMAQLDSLELYPFKEMIKAGVGSVMVAHLSIPAIDTTTHLPTSLSFNNVTDLLRHQLGFKGITFTDALDMQGVAKYFPGAEGAVKSILAGNDMLCLPQDVPESIDGILAAMKKGQIDEKDLASRVKKVLAAKYQLGLASWQPVPLHNLSIDLNKNVAELRKAAAEKSLTVLRWENRKIFPLNHSLKIAYIALGDSVENTLGHLLKDSLHARTFYFNYTKDSIQALKLIQTIKGNYDLVIMGFHGYAKYPANNFGISKPALMIAKALQEQVSIPSLTMFFGNPYAISQLCQAKNLVACYEDDALFQSAAYSWLTGKFMATGKLPVTVCPEFHFGFGL
ncbi:MAG: glycoside hydrolase family 3 [Bacteroidetes bacterium]|nr:glycoside hydrolase family 3 [Bacteroidota bacterium]